MTNFEITGCLILLGLVIWVVYEIRNAPLTEEETDLCNKNNYKFNKYCPDCGRRGYKTTLSIGYSYACKKCDIWWIIPNQNENAPEMEDIE